LSLVFFAVISEHFSKSCNYKLLQIISAMAAKLWYLKNVRILLGHPVCAHS